MREVTGEAQVETSGPAILIVIAGHFEVEARGSSECVQRGEAIFCADPGVITFKGSGRAYIAAT